MTAIIASIALLALAGLGGVSCAAIDENARGSDGEMTGAAVSAMSVTNNISYQGRLTNSSTGEPLGGMWYITFRLYNVSTGGTALDMDAHVVEVADGLFNTHICFDQSYFDGSGLWLGVQVEADPEMTPRQELRPVPYALSLRPGAVIASSGPTALTVYSGPSYGLQGWSLNNIGLLGISGSSYSPPAGMHGVHGISVTGVGVYGEGGHTGVYGNGTNDGVKGESSDGNAVHGLSTNDHGVLGESVNSVGVKGRSDNGDGVVGWTDASDKSGMFGHSTNGVGVTGRSDNNYGVLAQSENNHSLYIPGAGAAGVRVESASHNGVDVVSAGHEGVLVRSAGRNGIMVGSATWSGVYIASSGGDAIRVQTAGQDGLRIFDTVGRDYIRAGSDADIDFRVLSTGEVRSDIGFNTPASDFAEMIDVEGETTNYEPGDVLVISDVQNRAVTLSSTPYSRAIIGVYSTAPGYVGGRPVSDDNQTNRVPVAIMGIVPCKVSAENGAIARGDLLTTSDTPGHAMKAADPEIGTILGKALEPLDAGTGTIEVLVTLQ